MKIVKKLLLFIIFVTFLLLIYTVFYPNIEVLNTNINLDSNDNVIVNSYNLFGNLNKYLSSTGTVDNSKVGIYTLNYKVNYLFYHVKKKVIVNVTEKEPPVIELSGNNPSLVCPNGKYIEEGYTVFDNYDKDLTNKLERKVFNDRIEYLVKDSSNNISIAERKLEYKDVEKPVINLLGNLTMTIYRGNSYNEPGYSSSDNCDGDITSKVVITGEVDTNRIGSYTIKYSVTDSYGNKNVTQRIVNVIEKPREYGKGVIYLTFDDGPSYLTKEILDILDEENVKVTFFVTSANEYTKRAYDSGHTIGLHSYTHDYGYIYVSSTNYFNDLNNISDKVYDVIGIRPKIIRFPGGSSNTVSRNYNTGIMSYLTREVVNRGYSYFDWNIDANDAGSDIYNSTNIYYNVINHLSHNKTNVILMHDSGSHSATVNALRDIIRYGKEHGYAFKAITYDTPIVRHGVNN